MGPLNVHDLDELYRPLDPSAFRYNPRCLERSFNARPLHRFAGAAAVQRILAAQTIQEFLAVLDPTMGDVFSSVQDPAFFLHHAMVDRLWGMWQEAGPGRRDALNGTAWMFDPPWATNVSVDTVVEFGVLGGPRKIADLMDPLAGQHCYIYS
ncbi:putative polyphenol monooxygenase [Aspergillus fumigatus Af293]|uniref:Polyphenol monooxygenase, putative n=2 Tax=Aspergillus fumigatus TaxID=746128 RepID=Q4WQR9_ASPFU|nr:polyphenol monooxygenase, putative [Aspergillus fumigatus Af293]EAL89415.1 polyphenol monooxygenase, putative [Aspergillus fumigatus Af293]KAH1903502.1 hypothetical protein KXV57_006958 [Aspergillus fumigatus]KAH2278520.1 hypothetical protein KXW02_006867 [Aspergillus fumigatus]